MNSRTWTTFQVLTDPNNLVHIEKKSVVDRAALEELYILSPLANSTVSNKKTRTKQTSPVNDNSARIITKNNKKSTTRSSSSTRSTKHVHFNGLTTGPNSIRRNRKNSLPKAYPPTKNSISSSDTTENDEEEYIRSILRKKEEHFSHEPVEGGGRLPSLTAGLSSSNTLFQKRTAVAATSATYSNSRSSTMPGFKERINTNRQKAYRDGIKIAEQRTGMKFVESDAAKKKRRQLNGENMYKTSKSVPDSLTQFANEIHKVDRITPKEEISLGEKTQEAIRLQNIYDGLVANLEREPTDDEWCAAAGKFNMESLSQTINEGLEAKNKLVSSNLRMVQGVVNVYIRNGLEGQYNAGDLMQEGILALVRAAEKFDPSRGFRFSTYAMYWIRSAIKRDQLFQSRVVQVPQRMHENHKKIALMRNELNNSLNRLPTNAELSRAVGMTEIQIDRCEKAISQKFFSMDQTMVNRMNSNSGLDSNANTLQSIIESKIDENDFSNLDRVFLREDLIKALKFHLSEEEASILMLRFGMDSEKATSKRGGRTISEVSNMVGLKPDKVRRTINRSLKQLKVLVGDEFEFYNRDFNT